ncbi:MAG: DNA polymerase III subunit gamma/tau [Actinomycetota bacterium]
MPEDTQYQSLYRKYRPQGPEEVLGQDHVVRALTGAVREGRLAHAFLFCGPRGTGKTSTARILAKMVNCERGPTPEPCGTCEQCVRIREGQHLDVVEIDAASHGGVDDARDLREKAPTAPVQGREKVYIIDEAQRLSREAFDALLKVFEEPPPGVRFVLATTEPHKMPATIVGRCQRFDFRRVPVEEVAAHLVRVAEREGMSVEPDAALAIARQTEGSVRDALSLLDQASVLGAGSVDDAVVGSLVGSGRSGVQYALVDAIALGDLKLLFELVHGVVQDGEDIRHVTSATLGHLRDLLIVKTAPEQPDLLDLTADDVERLRGQATKFSISEIGRITGLLLAAQSDMRWTTSPRLSLELALVRAAVPEADPHPHGLAARIERLERIAAPAKPAPAKAAPPKAAPPKAAPAKPAPAAAADNGSAKPSRAAKPAAKTTPAPSLGGSSAVDAAMLRAQWSTVVQHLRGQGRQVLAANLEVATPASLDADGLQLVFPPDRAYGVTKVEERIELLRAALRDLFGIEPAVHCVIRTSTVPPDPEEDGPPPTDAEALARLTAELDARPKDGA